MTIREILIWAKEFAVSFSEAFVARTAAAFYNIKYNNFLDWDISLIVWAIFRFFTDILIMYVVVNAVIAILGVMIVIVAAPFIVLFSIAFNYFGVKKFHDNLDKRFGYDLGSLLIGLFWLSPLFIFLMVYFFLLK